MLRYAGSFSFIVFALLGPAAVAAPPTSGEISRAIEDLGATEFDKRQAATELLWQAGNSAGEALRQAVKSTDPEVRTRAEALLAKLRLGLRPETPPEVAALIDQFRFGGTAVLRRQALSELLSKGQWQAVLTLIRGEQNPQERHNLATAIAADAAKLVLPLVERDDLNQAEEVLELVATAEAGISQLTAFLLLTDRIDKHVELARARAVAAPTDESWSRLAYLLRAKGDQAGALEAAEKTADLILKANLAAEAGQWAAAATAADELFRRNPMRLETAAFAATFHRLAGNEAEHERSLDALLKGAGVEKFKQNAAASKPADPFGPAANVALTNLVTAVKTLLVNDRIEEALEIVRRINPPLAHTIYSRQHRHREALEFVAVTPEKTLDRAWLAQLPTPPPLLPVRPDYRFLMAMQVARQLRELGRHEQVEQIWQTLRGLDSEQPDRGRRLSMLALLAWQLGRSDEATRYAADAIEAGANPRAILSALAGREAPLALAWHERFRAENPNADQQKAIATAVGMVIPSPRRGKPPENWRQIVSAARTAVQNLPSAAKAERLVAFGHTCKIRGDLILATDLFKEAADTDPAASMHIGDVEAAAGNWAEAAKHYTAAVTAKPTDRLAGLLLGNALTQSGKGEAGSKQSKLANLALIEPNARYDTAKSVRELSLKDEIVRQLELVCRTALPDSPAATNASQEIGNIVSTNEPIRSAHCWNQVLLHLLNPSAGFNENEQYAYLVLAHVIHKVQARAALADGKAETVEAELAKCQRLFPAEVQTVVDLVPVLRERGMERVADQLLENALDVHRQVLKEFPNSATYFNNTAWLCARGQRRLDEALELVEKAIALSPDEAAYHDTLAEVHFQRGDREAAVAAAKRCAELAPDNTLFAARLKHFQNDELKSLDQIKPQ